MKQELRENPDGTVTLLYGGQELFTAMPPNGGTGVEGFRELYDQDIGYATRLLKSMSRRIMRATWIDTFTTEPGERGHIVVSATWKDGGSMRRVYSLRELPRVCRLRGVIIKDILEARGL